MCCAYVHERAHPGIGLLSWALWLKILAERPIDYFSDGGVSSKRAIGVEERRSASALDSVY